MKKKQKIIRTLKKPNQIKMLMVNCKSSLQK